MPMTPVYCSQCAHPVESRMVDDKMRNLCPKCGTIFYENPLPVAAAVVLNEFREVLLVKRKNEPRKGLWCLPIGFAETGESIGEAAIRELREESGIKGEIVRLLDASSMAMELYGEVLVVTFEVVRTGGKECAGDDAEEVRYFPPSRLPPMAFEPNVRAIERCVEEHKDEWAIEDSFQHLESSRYINMLSDSLVEFIKDNAKVLSALWLDEVTSNPLTFSYSMVDSNYLRGRVASAISHFTEWLGGAEFYREVRQFYHRMGAEQRYMGLDLHEVISSLTVLRKIILSYAHKEGVWNRAIDAYRVLELDRRIMLFFDEIIYFTAKGFAEG